MHYDPKTILAQSEYILTNENNYKVTIYMPILKVNQSNMFSSMKRTHTQANNSPIAQDIVQSSSKKIRTEKKVETRMNCFKSWDSTFTTAHEEDYRGDMTIALKDGQYSANVTTAPMSVKFSDVGPNGNLGTKFVPDNAFAQAKFVMTLEKGADSKVLAAMPTIEKEQDGYFNFLTETSTKMMTEAWDKQIPVFAGQFKKCKAAAKKEAKKNKDLDVEARAKELFLEGASMPIKDYIDEDGDGTPVNKMARRYQYTNRKTGELVINRPDFWKRNREGGYDNVTEKIKFLSKGSIVIAQVSFRLYAMTSYYGVATDMGKNVIVVWQKPSSGGSSKPKESAPEVPFFE